MIQVVCNGDARKKKSSVVSYKPLTQTFCYQTRGLLRRCQKEEIERGSQQAIESNIRRQTRGQELQGEKTYLSIHEGIHDNNLDNGTDGIAT